MNPFAVLIDHRETTSRVAGLLQLSTDFHVTVTHLKLGDYLVDGRFLFERKTMPDLIASINEGRLFAQSIRLASSSLRSALIVEGVHQDSLETGMSRERILGALVTVALFMGIPVLLTRTPDETVRMMLYAARQANAVATNALPRHGYRPRGKRARQLFILQGLPGIGPTRARQLLARFGSVAAVIQASVKELQAVEGLGKRGAETIRWAVEEASPEYI